MALPQDHISMALFCDFENVALGVRDANYDKFDIKRVLERLLLKGSIVVKKAYCDWERYKGFKAAMHEANFELIEIPHVRQSGKNSADIRLVVDALDLCYTKSHVNTFVIISGDSDFSPLVSKLRENAKFVIGVGVKQSTSDLLIANCDEFIFYDDLVRESQRQAARQGNRDPQQTRRSPEEDKRRREETDKRRTKAVEMAAETYEALVTDRDEGGRIWASVLKEAIKRRNPGFNENYYGFRTFGNLLEDAQQRGLLEFGRDEKSGAYVTRGTGVARRMETAVLPLDDSAMADNGMAGDSLADVDGEGPMAADAVHHADAPTRDAQAERGDRGERGGDRGDRGDRGERGQRGQRGRRGGNRSDRNGERQERARHGDERPRDDASGEASAPPAAIDHAPAPIFTLEPVAEPSQADRTDHGDEGRQAQAGRAGRKPAGKTAAKTAAKTPRKSARGKSAAKPEAGMDAAHEPGGNSAGGAPMQAPVANAAADTEAAPAKKAASRARRGAGSTARKAASKKKPEAA